MKFWYSKLDDFNWRRTLNTIASNKLKKPVSNYGVKISEIGSHSRGTSVNRANRPVWH